MPPKPASWCHSHPLGACCIQPVPGSTRSPGRRGAILPGRKQAPAWRRWVSSPGISLSVASAVTQGSGAGGVSQPASRRLTPQKARKAVMPGQLMPSLKEELFMVYSHHLTTDNASMGSFGAPCSHLTFPPTAGGKAAPAEAASEELLSSHLSVSRAALSKPDANEGKSHPFVPLSSIFCLISLNY